MVSTKDLSTIVNVLRRDSISMTTAAGSGHPTSCLSCAELMAVLFFDEMKYDTKDPQNFASDEFILSKGHSAPILYSSLFRSGCIHTNLQTLRKFKSPLEGHPVPEYLPWVKVATGSLGQGLSVGVGMALAAKFSKSDSRVYVLMGDSEVAEGSIYEAMQLAHHYKLDNLIAIVDINRLGQRGETMYGHDLKMYEKRFSGFGWTTLTVNGHSISEIQKAFTKAKKAKGPVMILAKTFKGKGVSFLENKDNWHGKALNKDQMKDAFSEIPASIMPKVTIEKPTKKGSSKSPSRKKTSITKYAKDASVATREAYGTMLARLAKEDNRVVAVDAEVSNSTFAAKVKEDTPSQFVEIFIAEQNLAGITLGLSKKGFRPYMSTFAAFLSRAHDQLRMASLSSASFTCCGSHAGISIGEDGSSQMGLGDISMFRNFLNSSVFYPSDAVSCEAITRDAKDKEGITYIRTSRPKTKILYSEKEVFTPGEFKVLQESKKDKIVLCGAGVTLHECLKAHEELKKEGIPSAVLDIYSIKPFNHIAFSKFVQTHGGKFIVAEDHYSEGGIYEMICSGIPHSKHSDFESKSLHVSKMPRSGKAEELLAYEGIDATGIVKAAKKLV